MAGLRASCRRVGSMFSQSGPGERSLSEEGH